MKVNALDHVNIITDDLAATTRFFVDIFGLDVRDAPAPLSPEHYQWLYDDNNRAIFHINSKRAPQAFQRETPCGPATGAIHHVALACSGHAGFVERLTSRGIDFRTNNIPSVHLRQIFFSEPNGILLELNFYGD
jgi:catechol 2,3-dioxygenase-like lactoylglutathione lyase family enzyme